MKRIGICLGLVLASPFLLLGFIIAFPTYYIRNGEEEENGGVESKNSCVRLMKIIVIGVFYLPITMLVLIPMVLVGVFVFPVNHIIKAFQRKSGKEAPEKQLETRWHSRNAQNFVYRPTNPEA